MDTVRSVLAASRLPRLETQMFLTHVLGVPRAWLIAHDTDPLGAEAMERFHALCERRLAGEPMAYLLGEREFMGHGFQVVPGVLIPRPETELLVETAIHHVMALGKPGVRVLDLGTGSGAVAVSVALACPGAEVIATDLSVEALDVARGNARRLGARVRFMQGSWYDAVSGEAAVDVIVSNPPYIAANDPHLSQGDLRYEPSTALTDGGDGLGALRAIVSGAPARLNPGGVLWVEHGWDQAVDVRGMLGRAGFSEVASKRDLAGIERISGGSYNIHRST